MKLKCKKCKYEWDYNGKVKPNKNYTPYASCPRCKTSVKVEEVK